LEIKDPDGDNININTWTGCTFRRRVKVPPFDININATCLE